MEVVVLVDSGSTHNFLQTRVARLAGLVIEQSRHLNVTIGNNGDELQCEGLCQNVEIGFGGVTFRVDFYLLPIYCADAVLGSQWLAGLGPILSDYSSLWMSFLHHGKQVKLHGLQPHAQLSQLTLGQLRRATRTNSVASWFQLSATAWPMQASDEVTLDLPQIPLSWSEVQQQALDKLLREFCSVFQPPKGLPPPRVVDHKIPLILGAAPIKGKPYRYPRFQKTEIEKQIKNMLDEGIIQPSTSPFSSSVLLVKKKDGSWRLCVDYRGLNSITVKDRYPIPTIDELFDELHGATIFSKLDLRAGYHQIRMNDEDVFKTAFRTHDGHFEFLVMPFGLTNVPSTFQAAMNELLRPMLRQFVLVFFDDMFDTSLTRADHVTGRKRQGKRHFEIEGYVLDGKEQNDKAAA